MKCRRACSSQIFVFIFNVLMSVSVEYISQSLPDIYVDKLLNFVAGALESSRHFGFYVRWCHFLLTLHGTKLKQRSQSVMAVLRSLQRILSRRHQDLASMLVASLISFRPHIMTWSSSKSDVHVLNSARLITAVLEGI